MADARRLGPGGTAALRALTLRTGPALVLCCMVVAGCAAEEEGSAAEEAAGVVDAAGAAVVLEREAARIEARVAAIDSVFQPLPLLTPAEESELRRFGNAQQLERARAMGIAGDRSAPRLERLLGDGALVTLGDNDTWVVRDLDYSQPLVVPSVEALLREIGTRFQSRLADLDVPPLRMEITSVLRSAEDQERLRGVNPNAASGESTHQYGTTVDIAYNAFAAPAEPVVDLDPGEFPELRPHLVRYGEVAVERVAGRRSKELQAILGEVLLELQREGRVMVTLERQQPVFHMTVTR